MIELFVQSRYQINRRKLKVRVKLFLEKRGISLEDYELSLAVVGDRKMKELNKKFRQKKETTAVLTFPLNEIRKLGNQEIKNTLLGEIVVSYPQARLLASKENKLVEEKLGELVEHGLTKLLNATS